ncbi:MAG TPA: hypothetical protein VFD05_04900 [Bacilli bacterium]|nr:hypothetical protein [Bacilli bacterium]
MKIFQTLKQQQRRDALTSSREYKRFREHYSLLYEHHALLYFDNDKDGYSLIIASIIIEVLQQIEKLKQQSFTLLAKENRLTTFTHLDTVISVPLFGVSNNLLITKELLPNFDLNHYLIDFLEAYNFNLLESKFTSLVFLYEHKNTRAYYHYDFNTVFIVNNQGRLDQRICLFDKNIKSPNYENIKERVLPAVKAYYALDKKGFITALYTNDLISQKLYNKFIRTVR